MKSTASVANGATLVNPDFAELIDNADIELIPLNGLIEKLVVVPKDTKITITCSVKLGLDRTMEFTQQAARAGYYVVPHLAARQVTSEAELRRYLNILEDVGVTEIYVIGGDAPTSAGPYSSAFDLLQTLAAIDHKIKKIGVGCYPEGHPAIHDDHLLTALLQKQGTAHYMVNQLCFSPDALLAWVRRIRAAGVTLPLHLGVPSPLHKRKLVELSLKIGVGASVRYLLKQQSLIANLFLSSAYKPEEFLFGLGGALWGDELNIKRLHFFSFNQIDVTVDWQRRLIAARATKLNRPRAARW
jgi:methylenetetrahydrofolate reductase (NADPH)